MRQQLEEADVVVEANRQGGFLLCEWNTALRVFLELGWPIPANLVCLFAEHRAETNGLKLKLGNSLLDAAAMRGLTRMGAATKDANRRLVTDQQRWSDSEAAFRRVLDESKSPKKTRRSGKYAKTTG